jgi:group I intron endonuclease
MKSGKKESCKYHLIYMTKNMVNGKSYIGCHSTNNLLDEYYGSGKKLLEEVSLFGRKSFLTGIIEFCGIDDLHEREKYWIKFYDTFNNGYNLNGGGGGTYGKKHTPDTLKKISNSLKNPSDNVRRKMRDGQLRRKENPGLFKIWKEKFPEIDFNNKMKEYSKKMSESLIGKNSGKKLSEAAKIKIGNSSRGRKFSESQIEKIRIKAKRKGRKMKNVTCHFCGKNGSGGNMTRYHFDNCKNKI